MESLAEHMLFGATLAGNHPQVGDVELSFQRDEVIKVLTRMDDFTYYFGDTVEDRMYIERNMDYGRPYIYAYPELTDLPSIGPQFGGEPELILGQEPDVIFITYETEEGADELQELTGIPVIVLGYGEDYGDLKTDYLLIMQYNLQF